MAVQALDLQRLFLRQHGIRIEPEMAHYVLRCLSRGGTAPAAPIGAPVPIMGADARTGLPLRQVIDLTSLGGDSVTV